MLSKTLFYLVALLVWGCATTSVRDQQQEEKDRVVDETKVEIGMGREMAAKLIGTFGLVEDQPHAQKYVSMVGHTVASQAGRPEIKFHFGILNTDEVNALATPGGYIFVTKGLLKKINSESELAGILGHEISHVCEKHMYDEMKPKRDVDASETIGRIVSMGKSDMAHNMSQMVNKGLKVLLEQGYTPEKESEADSVGSMYAQAAGYDPKALHHFIGRVFKDEAAKDIPKTHPPTQARLKTLDDFYRKNGLKAPTATRTAVLEKRFSLFKQGKPHAP